jgi:hypothetical protein
MKSPTSNWTKTVACALVAGCLSLPSLMAQGNTATGTWKWISTNRTSGQVNETTLKLKAEGGKLSGAFVGRNGNETAIDDGVLKGNEVAFSVTRERNGNKTTTKYQGVLAGDAIKGKINGNWGGEDRSFDWDAKRIKE